jgi:four helix bundle protein
MNKTINTFRDLIVWQKGMDLSLLIYRVSKDYPAEEKYGLVSQIRRSACSIPSNIAEGYGRHSTADYSRFLKIAISSLYELQTQLELSYKLEMLSKADYIKCYSLSREIKAMLISLIRKIK